MRWHLMYMVDETRGGRTYDESSFSDWMGNEDVRGRRMVGHALLRHTEYERWKYERFGRDAFTGRSLKNGRWGPDQPLSGFFLENAHRFLARLPRSRIADAYVWEQTLPIHDVDRFHEHYVDIEDSSVRFFERYLRRDEITVRMLEGLEALEDLYRYETNFLDLAFVTGMFHRVAEVVGRYRKARLGDPAGVPGPLTEDVQSVLRGYRTAREARLYCDDIETRAAAGALHILMKWQDRKSEPQWAITAIEEDLGQDLRIDDWHNQCAEYWARPFDSTTWLTGEDD